MSSSKFYCELVPDRRWRRLPQLCGLLAALAGLGIVTQLPLPSAARLLAAAAWLSLSLHEVLRHAATQALVRRIRLTADGRVSAKMPDGRWLALELLPGSLVTSRTAWLRLRLGDGRDYGEFLRGRARRDRQWHRLQLIWQLGRRSFGRPDRS